MKFLGITAYAAAVLLTSVYASPGRHHHGNGKKWHHKGMDYDEIHYEVISPARKNINTKKIATATGNIATATGNIVTGISPVIDDGVTLPTVDDIAAECPLTSDTLFGEEVNHDHSWLYCTFTGIFYEDFNTGGTGQDILGPLAVGGNFHAPNYIVNANHGVDCSADETSSYNSIGLVIGGDSTTFGTHVRGDSLIAGNGDQGQFDQQLQGCRVITDEGTGHFDFPRSASDAETLSQRLASLNTNRVLNTNGVVSAVPNVNDDNFKVFHFNTCQAASCGVSASDASTPDEIFFGIGNWNGPNGDVPSNADTVVFNVPVTSGDTITLRTNAPTHGFNSCNAVYNFYPVDENGNFDPNGEFTIHRETGSQFEGLVIAPRAHIRDGNTGNFAGTVVGLDYDWLDPSGGVEIHDWRAAGCSNYGGCLPGSSGGGGDTTAVNPPVPTSTSTSISTDTGPSVTRTTPSISGDTTPPIVTSETSTTEVPPNSNDETSEPGISVSTTTEYVLGPTQTVYVVAEKKHEWDDDYHGNYKKKNKAKKHKKGNSGYDKSDKSW
ncbi:hypothetical protein K492DRAFT_192821 [Lichtheimia hyalospora FSU 10163]|nr:hypothetical protein K492DRAFT_192821 [Lichtheimia hyalospora FSU 10163]